MITVDLEQIKDCEHCSHTFGSFGCCDTVSNEWVYSCREGQREYVFNRVLKIINRRVEWCREQYNRGEHIADVYALALVREDVEALKGEWG